eukprot:scaffold34263_cov42-Phaeocystis_antarctica.AAC.2
MKGRLLDAAARQAAEIQRRAFLHMLGLRVGDVLQPLDPDRGAAAPPRRPYPCRSPAALAHPTAVVAYPCRSPPAAARPRQRRAGSRSRQP